MEEIRDKRVTWQFPATRSARTGKTRAPHDYKHVVCYNTTLFSEKVIVTSDLHSHSEAVLDKLLNNTNIDLSEYHMITLGDMAGDNVFGSDGNPTPFYADLQKRVKSLVVIQGNHDLPPTKTAEDEEFDKRSFLPNGRPVKMPYGTIGGVHGTISRRPHPHKMPEQSFYDLTGRLKKAKDLDIFVTHETPRFFINGKEFIGKDQLYQEALASKAKLVMYGHCHHRPCYTVHTGPKGGTKHFLNVDARVVIFNPPDDLNLKVSLVGVEPERSEVKSPEEKPKKPVRYVPVGVNPADVKPVLSKSAKKRLQKKRAKARKQQRAQRNASHPWDDN